MDCPIYRNDENEKYNEVDNEILIPFGNCIHQNQDESFFIGNSPNDAFSIGMNYIDEEENECDIFQDKAPQAIDYDNDDDFEMPFLKQIEQKIKDLNEEKEEETFIVFTPPTEKYKNLAEDEVKTTFNRDFQQKLKEEENQSYKRKVKPDDIRKKIKVNFFKTLRKGTNKKLKEAGSKDYFEALNQGFICNISKNYNRPFMSQTWKEILIYKFPNAKQSDSEKYDHNLKILQKIEEDEFSEAKTKFDPIGNLTIYQLFEEYLRSEEYLESLFQVHLKEKDFYLERYRELSKNFIEFFLKDK